MDMDIEFLGFDIECELGEGVMVMVYLVIQCLLQCKVVLKVMVVVLVVDLSFVECFLCEGWILVWLLYLNMVIIYDIGNVGSCYYMVMEYLFNGMFKECIQQGFDFELGLVYVWQVVVVFGYVYFQGLVY